jgi:D-amino-acid oxidase
MWPNFCLTSTRLSRTRLPDCEGSARHATPSTVSCVAGPDGRRYDVLVIGCGVVGLTTAIRLAEADLRVCIRTADPPSATTSAVAGAMWGPYLVEPRERVAEWSRQTLAELHDQAADPATGVRLATGIEASRTPFPAPWWAAITGDVRRCEPSELPDGFTAGYRFTVPMVDMPKYLDCLSDRFRAQDGTVDIATVNSLAEAATDAPVVVNCAGMGAAALVPDPELRPVRGQHVIVTNPGLREFFSEETDAAEWASVMPHHDRVVLGGLAQDGVSDPRPDLEAAARILARCIQIEPRLAQARVLGHGVGLRPTRAQVRVDEGEVVGGTRIFHNYGHGGAGVSLAWGCANEITQQVVDSR